MANKSKKEEKSKEQSNLVQIDDEIIVDLNKVQKQSWMDKIKNGKKLDAYDELLKNQYINAIISGKTKIDGVEIIKKSEQQEIEKEKVGEKVASQSRKVEKEKSKERKEKKEEKKERKNERKTAINQSVPTNNIIEKEKEKKREERKEVEIQQTTEIQNVIEKNKSIGEINNNKDLLNHQKMSEDEVVNLLKSLDETLDDTHKRHTFLIRKDLMNRLEVLSKEYGRGFMKNFINIVLEEGLDKYEEKLKK